MVSNKELLVLDSVPSDWKIKAIGDIGNIVTGATPKTSEKNNWIGKLPFVSPSDISDHKYVTVTERTVNRNIIGQNRLIPRNSILYTCIASIGKIAVSTEECTTNQQINSVIPNDDVDTDYLYYSLLNRTGYIKTLSGTTAVPIINKSLFSKIKVLIPSIKEQQKIAAILSSVDEAIEKTEQIIEQTETVKKGLMQQLLTKGIGHTEFKNSSIGKIPETWSVKKGEELFTILSGYAPSKIKESNDVDTLYLKVNDMNNLYKFKFINDTELHFDSKNNANIKFHPVGTIVFPKRGAAISTNKMAILKREAAFDTNIMGLFCNEVIINKFLYYYLKGYGLYNISDNSTIPQLNNKHIYPLLIPVPPLDEQRKIVETIEAIEEKLLIEEKECYKLSSIKKGLMQQLLTGKVRVPINENEEVPT